MSIELDPASPFDAEIKNEATRLLAKYNTDAVQVAKDMQGTYFDDDPKIAFWRSVTAELIRRTADPST